MTRAKQTDLQLMSKHLVGKQIWLASLDATQIVLVNNENNYVILSIAKLNMNKFKDKFMLLREEMFYSLYGSFV